MKVNCLIVDDEPLSQDVVEGFIKQLPKLQIVAKCNDAFAALEAIRNNPVDLIFLDINMPKLSGINFIKSLTNPPLVIFTTAYPEFAVEGFEVEAVDYLLKPISLERFIKATNKALAQIETASKKDSSSNFLMVKSDKKLFKVEYDNIKYFSAIGDYVKVFTTEGTLITNDTLKHIEEQLPPSSFARIHKSHIINLSAFEYMESNQIKVGEEFLPVGNKFKDELMTRLKD